MAQDHFKTPPDPKKGIKDSKKPIIDVSHHKKNLVSIDKRFTRLQKKDPSKTLEEIYADQSNVLSLIEKYRNELSESEKIIETANSSKILQQYEQNTQTAKDKSVFGSPTFIVGSELFWGDDRLEDAIEWARK